MFHIVTQLKPRFGLKVIGLLRPYGKSLISVAKNEMNLIKGVPSKTHRQRGNLYGQRSSVQEASFRRRNHSPVGWYLRYSLSYRDLEEMMLERGLTVDHSTIYRWIQAYAPELQKRSKPHLKVANDSYRVDETYLKVKGQWKYLYRAVDPKEALSNSC
jgi:hypothetical protein